MNVTGERILIFGDSLSHHGTDDAPEIWDVDQGSARPSSQPGDLLGSLLLEAGAAAVRVDANVGRSARNFWTAPNRWQHQTGQALIDLDQQFQPTKVVVILGTNDADNGAMDQGSINAIRDAYQNMGAEIWAVGPPVFADQRLNANAEKVYEVLSSTFPGKVIDMRPLSDVNGRASDGVHFGQQLAVQTAQGIASQLTSTSSGITSGLRSVANSGLGLAVVALVALAGFVVYRRWRS